MSGPIFIKLGMWPYLEIFSSSLNKNLRTPAIKSKLKLSSSNFDHSLQIWLLGTKTKSIGRHLANFKSSSKYSIV